MRPSRSDVRSRADNVRPSNGRQSSRLPANLGPRHEFGSQSNSIALTFDERKLAFMSDTTVTPAIAGFFANEVDKGGPHLIELRSGIESASLGRGSAR